jgi:Arc/MetJ-type ribon-helix-helix transcriptional regulator
MSMEKAESKVLSVPVPKGMEDFIRKRVSEAGFQTVSEYFRALVRADQKRAAEEELEVKLLEALDSGRFEKVQPELFERLRARVSTKAQKTKP